MMIVIVMIMVVQPVNFQMKYSTKIIDFALTGTDISIIGRFPPRYVAVPDGEPGTGTNYEKRKWNTTFRSEIPTGKKGPPF